MSFLHVEFLYVVMPILFILFWFILTQEHNYQRYFSEEVMQRLSVTSNTLTMQARNALFFMSAIMMVLAMSGPVIDNGTIEIKAKSADIMIALDISDSMLAEDVYPDRLKRAKQKAMEFISLAKKERIGVVAFAKNSYLVSPLSFDKNAVNFLLSKLNTDSITEKGTNFLSLLETVDKKVENKNQRYLFLLTDGGDKKDFSQEIAYAKAHNIVVFILGIGTQKGAPIKTEDGSFVQYHGKIIISKLNDAIASLATKSGGVYIESVNSNEDIKRMYKEVESRAKQKELKSKKIQNYIPLFYYPLGVALMLLLFATSSMSKRKEVAVPSAFLLAILLGFTSKAEAGVLDFMTIDDAKKAYIEKDYTKAQKLYEKLQQSKDDPKVYYNSANTYYKEGRYKEAIQMYNKAYFKKRTFNAKKYANLGNAYVKLHAKGSLQNAKEMYEKSLKYEEDKDVRDNLNAVIDALKKEQQKKQKKQQQKQQKNNQNKSKNQKNNQQQNQKNKQQKDQKNRSQQGQNKKDSQQNKSSSQQQQNNSEQEKKKQEQSDGKNRKKNAQNRKQNQDKKEQQHKGTKSKEELKDREKDQQKDTKDGLKQQQKSVKEKKEKKALEELRPSKERESQKKKPEKVAIDGATKKQVMSDEEQVKWLKALDKKQGTYLYMLNQQQNQKELRDEKPW